MKYDFYGEYEYNGEKVGYNFGTTATYSEQIALVDAVTRSVMSDNFVPLLIDVMFDFCLIVAFTDLDYESLFYDEDGTFNIDKFDEFNKQTGMAEALKGTIEPVMLYNLRDSVEKNIAYKTGIHIDSITSEIVNLIKIFAAKAESTPAVDPTLIQDFLGKVNMDNIVNSVVDEYVNSDEHDKNVKEMLNNKDEEIAKLKSEKNAVTAKNVLADKDK
jgi:hypothetical protein